MTRIAAVWSLPPGSIRPTNAVVDALLVTTRPALANTPSVISQGCPPLHRDPGARRGALGAEVPLLGAGGARPRPGGRLPLPGSHPRRRAHGPPPFVSGVSRDGRWASSSDRPRLGQQEPLRTDTEALVPAAQRPPSLPSRPLPRLPPPPSSAHLLPCRARCHSPRSPLQSVTFLATRALQVNQPKEVDDPALGRLSLRKRQNLSFVPAEASGARCRETRSTRRLLRPPGRADGCLLRRGRGEIAFLHPLRAAEGAEVEFISPSRKPRKAGISAFAKTQNFQTHI